MSRLFQKPSHRGKETLKYRFDVKIKTIAGLPATVGSVLVAWTRGTKVAMTKTAKVSQGKATFNETLSLISTLYRDPKTGAFDEKNYKLAVKEVTKKGVAGKTLGGIALDLGAFGGTAGSELEKSLEFKIPGGDSNGVMDVVIKSSWLQNYRSGGDDAMTVATDFTARSSEAPSVTVDQYQDLSGFDFEEHSKIQKRILELEAEVTRARGLEARLSKLEKDKETAESARTAAENMALELQHQLESTRSKLATMESGSKAEPNKAEKNVDAEETEQLRKRIAELENALQGGSDNEAALESELSELRKREANLSSVIKQLEEKGRAEVGSLRTQLAELKKSVIVEISDATAQMNNEILSMQFKMKTQLSDSESNNVDLRESVSQMQSELEEAQISIANLQQSLATREEELASKNRESSQLQSSLQTKDSEIAALRDGIEGLKNEIKERVEEITFLRRDVAESNQSKLALREEVTVLKAKLEASEMSFESTQRELEETKSELHKLAEVSNRGEEESTAATSPDEEDQSLSGRERGYVADIKVLETKLQKNQEELAASKTDAASLRKELASIKSEASKVERSMEDLRVNYETALSEMSALQAANAMAASDARIAKGELESMISAYEDETKKVEELSEQLAALKRTENEKETIAAKQAQEIETLERKVAALEAEIENIAMRRVKEVEEVECARTKLETALADKKTLLSEKLDELSLVITERDRLQEECALRKKEVDDLTERADNLQREVDQVQQVMEQGLLQASDVVARIDRVNATPLEVAPTEEAIDEETTALINRLEDEVARLKEQIRTLEQSKSKEKEVPTVGKSGLTYEQLEEESDYMRVELVNTKVALAEKEEDRLEARRTAYRAKQKYVQVAQKLSKMELELADYRSSRR